MLTWEEAWEVGSTHAATNGLPWPDEMAIFIEPNSLQTQRTRKAWVIRDVSDGTEGKLTIAIDFETGKVVECGYVSK